MGCHFLLQCMKVESESEVAQSCLTLHDPMDCSLPGSSIYGIFRATVLEWGAIAFSRNLDRAPQIPTPSGVEAQALAPLPSPAFRRLLCRPAPASAVAPVDSLRLLTSSPAAWLSLQTVSTAPLLLPRQCRPQGNGSSGSFLQVNRRRGFLMSPFPGNKHGGQGFKQPPESTLGGDTRSWSEKPGAGETVTDLTCKPQLPTTPGQGAGQEATLINQVKSIRVLSKVGESLKERK